MTDIVSTTAPVAYASTARLLHDHGDSTGCDYVSARAFSPTGAVALSASTISAHVTLPVTGNSILVTNAAGDYAFVTLGAGVIAATIPTGTAGTAGVAIPSGQSLMLDCPSTVTEVAVILNSGTGTVFVTRGYGSAH